MIPRIHVGGHSGPSIDSLRAPRLVKHRPAPARRLAPWISAAFLAGVLIAMVVA